MSTIEARIDRATEDLTAYLGLYGLSTAQIGAYSVAWDGESVTLERVPSLDAAQLELPDLDDSTCGEQLNETVLARAAEGRLPCPWCDTPLATQSIEIEGEPEVRLYCPVEACGFEEY